MKIQITELPYVNSADLFDKIADQPWAMFLDSGVLDTPDEGGVDQQGYDVLAIKPHATLVFDGELTHFRSDGAKKRLYGDVLAILQAAIPHADNLQDVDCQYFPGAIGYFSYDLARQFEDLPNFAKDDEQLPPMAMGIFHVLVVVDHALKKTQIVQLGDDAAVGAVVEEWQDLIEWLIDFTNNTLEFEEVDKVHPHERGGLVSGMMNESMDQDIYRKCFETVRNYTVEGDCYQVNLTKRFSAMVAGDAWLTYRYLRESSPAPYGAYFNMPFAQVLSNSPESFIQCRGRQVVTRPIKGTRPRAHHNEAVDKAIAKQLLNSEKDKAENVMIVDLMRNDLSRCCELGSVTVPSLFELHSFANVHHLVSTVTGVLRSKLHVLDLLRSCFPGGSITGAPKIRAMEIIEELEPSRRGLYCGAIAYVGVDGSLESNIAIRTIVVKDGVARYAAGGGLVIDSKVDEEYQELLDKARMMNDALFLGE